MCMFCRAAWMAADCTSRNSCCQFTFECKDRLSPSSWWGASADAIDFTVNKKLSPWSYALLSPPVCFSKLMWFSNTHLLLSLSQPRSHTCTDIFAWMSIPVWKPSKERCGLRGKREKRHKTWLICQNSNKTICRRKLLEWNCAKGLKNKRSVADSIIPLFWPCLLSPA